MKVRVVTHSVNRRENQTGGLSFETAHNGTKMQKREEEEGENLKPSMSSNEVWHTGNSMIRFFPFLNIQVSYVESIFLNERSSTLGAVAHEYREDLIGFKGIV